MISFPNAKINIGLNILKKRKDGYHDIDSVFYPVKGLCDVLEIIKADEFNFSSTGLDIPGNSRNNLCVKAFFLLKDKYDISNVAIHLHKIIPMGAGLGGGSADAAFVINMLDSLFELNISIFEKEELATKIGSDCAFFINNVPAQATGRGNLLNDIKLNISNYYCVVINPSIHIGTQEAYSNVIPKERTTTVADFIYDDLHLWEKNLVNEFEASVLPNYPVIKEIKEQLYADNAIYASMSGSGSTVFGIFEKEPILTNINSDHFIWIGKL